MLTANTPSAEVRHWLGEITEAKKREKDFRKTGREVIEIYAGDKPDEIPFNILYSNVETLLPALFSQVPKPVVQRRFKDEDPMGKAASLAAQRMLEYLCDTNVEGYETYETSMVSGTLDALLPGRGVTGIRYDADVTDSGIEWEQICTDSRKWDTVYFGFARKWSKVPWIAYEEYVDKDEAERLFGAEIAAKIEYTDEDTDEDDESAADADTDDDDGDRKTALVYQIWDRAGGKKVHYISPHYTDGYLKSEDDPYGITGFFNCPRPLQFLARSNDMMPVAPYQLYRNQAEELNNITRRITKIISALKVRGVYDGALGDDVGKILESADLSMLPTDNGASLATQGGIDKAVWLWPIDKLILVMQQLVQAREVAKRVIYEITGVSDIVRGQSVASETLGAQKIKEAWGTMRLKRLQKETQRYSRDTLRIMLEVAAKKLSVNTWAKATGLPFSTAEQKVQARQLIVAAQMSGQQPDPKAMQVMQSPGWDDVLGVLRNNMQRAYRIDIETNSTIDVEATEDQKNISEVMQAIAQFLHGIGPLLESGTMDFSVAQEMLLTIVRRFRFGTEVEDSIKAMKPPQPKDDGSAAAAQADNQAAMAALQQQGQAAMAEMKQAMMELQQKAQQEKAELQQKAQQQMAELQQKAQQQMAELQQKHAEVMAKADASYRTEQMKANISRDTDLKRAAIEKEKAIEVANIQAGVKIAAATGAEESVEPDEQTLTLEDIAGMMQEMMGHMTAPKTIERGTDGKAISVGGRTVLYGPDGRPTGLQ